MSRMFVVLMLLTVFITTAEAKGRRGNYQPQYYAPQQQVFASVPAQNLQQTTQSAVQQPAKPSVGVGGIPPVGTFAYMSAQWKAEQCAARGSVSHIGGSFGGGSFEGNGFGATPEQAIQVSCFWGQRTPIEIGVARGANGYYATIFCR